MIKKVVLIPFCLIIILAVNIHCSSSVAENPKKETKENKFTAVPDPCEVLSEAFLNKFFDIDTAKVSRDLSKYSPHPSCSAIWRKKNADEIEAAYGAQMQKYLADKMAGKDVKVPIESSSNRISLTFNKNRSESKEAGEMNFESSMKILREGMKVEVKGKEYESKKRETIPVSGVGDRAMWVPSMNQISVLARNQIFHLNVDTGQEDEKEMASSMATEIIKSL